MNINKNHLFAKIFNDLKISLADHGYAELSTEWRAQNVCSPFSRIYYIVKGEGFVRSRMQFLKLTAGNCYFLPADLTYDYWCETSLSQLYFHVMVTEPGGLNFFSGVDSFGSFPVGAENMQKIFAHYTAQDDFLSMLKLKACLDEALYRFIGQYQIRSFSGDSYSPEVLQATKYISRNLSVQLTAADIAADQFISESKLTKEFKAETGTTIGKYIDGLIFSRAEFLLSKTNHSIKNISNELGFCDQFYFARRFRQKFGEAPLAYRKRVKAASKI